MRRGTELTSAALRRMPLPRIDSDADKQARGQVVVVGGGAQTPGAVILAGEAALRAGAGKLRIATAASVAPAVGAEVPEALVLPLAEAGGGQLRGSGSAEALSLIEDGDVLLLGSGLLDGRSSGAFARAVVSRAKCASIVLDAGALTGRTPGELGRFGGRVVLTPHAREMATLVGCTPERILAAAEEVAREVAADFGAVVALKGPETVIASPDGRLAVYRGGGVGLATSGSGDVLAGLAAAMLARTEDPMHAACWAVYLHGEAGNALTARHGGVGLLARELSGAVPAILNRLG